MTLLIAMFIAVGKDPYQKSGRHKIMLSANPWKNLIMEQSSALKVIGWVHVSVRFLCKDVGIIHRVQKLVGLLATRTLNGML